MPNEGATPSNGPRTIPRVPFHASAPSSRTRSRLLDIALLSRYRRRRLMAAIEAETERKLLCYVGRASINRFDTHQLVQLIETIELGARITFLLNSPGGDVDAAEKMAHLLREACSSPSGTSDNLEVVVPDSAKSAATLIALGADRIIMSDSSELGPIDPQFQYTSDIWVPASAWISAYEEAEQRCMQYPNNSAFAAELGKFDPVLVAETRQAVSRARTCAENLLRRQGGNYTAASSVLIDVNRFPSHGQMIDWRTAKEIGISQVHPMDRRSQLWQQYWRLYRHLLQVCGTRGRVFESRDRTIILKQ